MVDPRHCNTQLPRGRSLRREVRINASRIERIARHQQHASILPKTRHPYPTAGVVIQCESDHVPPDLTELLELLTADRERTSQLIAALTDNVSTIVEATRLTATDDEHDPEGATIAFERSQTSSLLQSATSQLADIDAALDRLENGTYGRCEQCGVLILPDRLRARPAARTCIGCAA